MLSYAISNISDDFIFILNEKFKSELIKKHKLTENVTIDYISDYYSKVITNDNVIIRSYKLSKCLRRYQRRHHPDKIVLAFMPPLLPLMPIFVHTKQTFRGIVFKGPNETQEKKTKRIINSILYGIIYKFRCFDKVWLVNNKDLADNLNNIYKTNVYSSLPDPINICSTQNDSIINKYKNTEKIILFHGGAMRMSKGTLDLIKALELLPISLYEKFVIIFAGKISEPAVKEYLIEFIRTHPQLQVIYTDKFISFENLCSYISISDYVVIPYKRTEQSSGILGYAAYYNIPVIGPSSGLLGRLIIDNELGITLDKSTPEGLLEVLHKLVKRQKSNNNLKSQKYISQNSIENFTNIIFTKG